MKKQTLLLSTVVFILSIFAVRADNDQLWYKQPAKEWMEALPLGNGRLGIMIHGGVEKETVGLNEITMWSGKPDPFQQRSVTPDSWTALRQLFFDGKYLEGNQIGSELLAGSPHSFGSHVPLGDMTVAFDHPQGEIAEYKRMLDINQAVSTVSYRIGDISYTREYFCSNPANALVTRFTSNKKEALNLVVSFDMLREANFSPSKDGVEFKGTVSFPIQGPGGVDFMGKVAVKLKDGSLEVVGDKIRIVNATTVDVIFDLRTDLKDNQYQERCQQTVSNALLSSYEQLKKNHTDDYARLYNRVKLSFGKSGQEHLPTDERWDRLKAGQEDIGMDALFFHYARYLQIASSRENSPLPTALQGLWNDNLACNSGWTNDYHLDMNTQMNYWLSNVGNLAETNIPLFNYIDDLAIHGAKTAKEVYNARGWTAHTVANVWGYTASGSGVNWGLFPTASSWIASHLWTQYLYTQDKTFLKERVYPILKSNSEFLLDYMVEDPKTGYLMTGPSTSPENAFVHDGQVLSLSMMPAGDRQLVYETFASCMQAATILGTDPLFIDTLQSGLDKLPPIKIGSNGAIQEWFEDFEEAQPNHRHTTHLLGLYPFSQITKEKTPLLAEAARKTIEKRLSAPGWEDVEWSRANMISFYARLGDAQQAYESVVQLQREFARENLLTISPEGIGGAPSDIFVFDGNQGGGAGIAEMLLQSHNDVIQLLPALPTQWKEGSFKGLCVRGGAEVDVEWALGEIRKATFKAQVNNHFHVKIPEGVETTVVVQHGKKKSLSANVSEIVNLEMNAGETIELLFK